MQVVWETDSLASMTPSEAAAVRVVHLAAGAVADADATMEALIQALPARLPHSPLEESTLTRLPPLFASVLRIWQRYPSVALEDGAQMAARLQQAAATVGDLFLQVTSAASNAPVKNGAVCCC